MTNETKAATLRDRAMLLLINGMSLITHARSYPFGGQPVHGVSGDRG